MIWRYDEAIVDDLKASFKVDDGSQKPAVGVVSPENIVSIAAQIQEDQLSFPIIAVERDRNTPVDTSLMNFTRMHQGVETVFDNETNMLYYEKAVPIKLSYMLAVMSPNTADVDEILRELIFKYTHQYFLSIHVPYESKRRIRFGVVMDKDKDIEWYSTTSDYLQEGKLHSAGIHLIVDGAVLLTYTPVHLRRLKPEIGIVNPAGVDAEPYICKTGGLMNDI